MYVMTLFRHNVKLGGMLYNIFSYSLGSGDKQQDYTLGTVYSTELVSLEFISTLCLKRNLSVANRSYPNRF
jgi:hypothetical protein